MLDNIALAIRTTDEVFLHLSDIGKVMGNFFSRSSSRSGATKKRLKTRKHDPLGQNETSIVALPYSGGNNNDFNDAARNDYEKWNRAIEQQSQMGMNSE